MEMPRSLVPVSSASFIAILMQNLFEAALNDGDLRIQVINFTKYYSAKHMVGRLNSIVVKAVSTFEKEVRSNDL